MAGKIEVLSGGSIKLTAPVPAKAASASLKTASVKNPATTHAEGSFKNALSTAQASQPDQSQNQESQTRQAPKADEDAQPAKPSKSPVRKCARPALEQNQPT